MIRSYVACLLALLIALQSVSAMAEAHELYKSGVDHLELDHFHGAYDSENAVDKSFPDSSSSLLSDCEHCCHCHGSVVLIGSIFQLTEFALEKEQADYQFNLTSGIPPSLFRPPIA
jgi:hypothetical protein